MIAGGLVSLGVLAERFFGFQLSRRQWLGLLVIAAGMAVLAVTAHSERNHSSFGVLGIVCFELAGVAIGLGCVVAHRVELLRERHGVLLGIAAGILFGVADISIKAVTSGDHGILGLIGPWTFAGILAGLAAFYASARSLQIGNAIAVIAATATAANILGIVGGIVVFGDPLGNDALTMMGRLLAFTFVVLAVGLMPAPIRAQQAVRDDPAEGSPEDASAVDACAKAPATDARDSRRTASTRGRKAA